MKSANDVLKELREIENLRFIGFDGAALMKAVALREEYGMSISAMLLAGDVKSSAPHMDQGFWKVNGFCS